MGATLGRASPPGRPRSGRGEGSHRRARRVHRPARRAVRPGRARRGGRVRPGPPRGRVRARSSTWRDATGPRGAVRPSSPIPPREGGAPAPGADPGPPLDPSPAGARAAPVPDVGLRRSSGRAPRPGPGARRVRPRRGRPRPSAPAIAWRRSASSARVHRRPPIGPSRSRARTLPGRGGRRQGRSHHCARHGTFSGRTGRFSREHGTFSRRPIRAWKRPVRRRDFCGRFEPPSTARFSCARHVYRCSTVRFRKTYLARGPSNSRGPGALQGRRSLA